MRGIGSSSLVLVAEANAARVLTWGETGSSSGMARRIHDESSRKHPRARCARVSLTRLSPAPANSAARMAVAQRAEGAD